MKRKSLGILAAAAVVVAIGGVAIAADGRGGRMQEMGNRMFQEADANSDGAVSAEEFAARLQARFKEADADGDGFASRAEIIAAIEKIAEGRRMKGRAGAISDRMVERLDLDGDGRIASAEIENRARKHFALADWNDDGKVEVAELQRMRPGGDRGGHFGRHGGWWRGGHGN